MKNLATSTIQDLSSITTSPPEPIIAPTFFSESKSSWISRLGVTRQPPDGPPIWTALNFPSPLMPPPISNITFLREVPIGTSIRPVFEMLPVRAKAFVPGEFSGPMLLNHFAPLLMITGTLASVSTLLRTVGSLKRPCSTVLGGLTLGIPLLPSIEAVRAEPSPQTNAPAPRFICILNE